MPLNIETKQREKMEKYYYHMLSSKNGYRYNDAL